MRHMAMIHDRGGVRRLFDLTNLESVEWGRELSGKSTGIVTIVGDSCSDQLGTLSRIRSRRHELVIFRDGVRVWEGPIEDLTWLPDGVKITACDIKHYLDGDVLSKAWPGPDGGGPPLMTDRIEEILEYELEAGYQMRVSEGGSTIVRNVPRWESLDPPVNILPHIDIRPGGVLTTVSTEPFQMMLGEHLDRLAESGLDYTVVGRSLVIWDSAEPIGRTRTLTEADFYGDVSVHETGSDFAAIAHVTGENDDDESDESILVVGSDGKADDYYGIWTHLASSQSDHGGGGLTVEALASQAYRQRLWRRTIPLDIRVSNGGIVLNESLGIHDLVPGVEVPVRAVMNLREVQQVQRLRSMRVTESADGEEITVSLEPWGDVHG